nr:uncharacterized protein CTRU02_14766 [Colletotrichum truncatum]KAF6781774.1 hypothetical protein CTRU02_14766 [Colletotrichum truncatum]
MLANFDDDRVRDGGEPSNPDSKARLLEGFALGAGEDGPGVLEMTARELPGTVTVTAEAPPDEEHAGDRVADDGADADARVAAGLAEEVILA